MNKNKGQSSIEYLTTYGWMLLAVGITGGAIFSVAGNQNLETVKGFSETDVTVEDFAVTTDGGFDIILKNTGSETVTINSVNISENGDWSQWAGTQEIKVSNTQSVALANITESQNSDNLEITINYDIGGLEGLQTSGVITGGFQVTKSGSSTGDTPEPLTSNDFEVNQK